MLTKALSSNRVLNELSFNIKGQLLVKREEGKEHITKSKREQIMEAALNVFSRKGFGKSTIPDIAQEAGTAVGTIYNYFESKQDLLLSIITNYVVTQPLVNLLKNSLDADDTVFLNSLFADRLKFGLEDIDKGLFILSEIQRAPRLRQEYAEKVMRPMLRLAEEYLNSRISSGTFRNLEPGISARAIGGMIIGFIILCRIEGENSPMQRIPPQELANELASLVLKGLQIESKN